MAYMDQKTKREIKEVIVTKLKEAGVFKDVKFTLAVKDHMKIVCNIKSASVDLVGDYVETRNSDPYFQNKLSPRTYVQYHSSYDTEKCFKNETAKKIMKAIVSGLNSQNYNNSDIMTDYFDVGYYVDINIGQYNKPFVTK